MIPQTLTKSIANRMKAMAGYVPSKDQARLERRRHADFRAARMNYPGWCGMEIAGTARLDRPDTFPESTIREAYRAATR